jgi:hypothetical protein
MSATYKAADIGRVKLPDGTSLDMNITIPEAYDMTGKKVVFAMRVSRTQTDLIFQTSSEGTAITITDQTVAISIPTAEESEHDSEVTFGGLVTDYDRRDFEFAIDLKPVASGSDTDYRIQGSLYFRSGLGEFVTED